MKARNDDFKERRKHLEKYSSEELKAYFFELTDQMIDPLLELSRDYTTPAIERSVLMRMGFSSTEAKAITNKIIEHNLLSYGAGHVVYKYHLNSKISIREAGLKLLDEDEMKKMVEEFNHEAK